MGRYIEIKANYIQFYVHNCGENCKTSEETDSADDGTLLLFVCCTVATCRYNVATIIDM